MELAYIARAIRRNWWVVVVCAAIGGLSGYLLDSGGSAEYEATSVLLLSSGSGGERYVQNEFVILGSNAVAEQAADNLSNVTAGQVSDGITLQRIPDSDVVRITASAASPSSARTLANTYADAYIALATGSVDSGGAQIEALDDAIAGLEDRLDVVDREIAVAMAPYLDDPAGIIVPGIEQVAPTLATERSVLLEQYSQLLFNRNEIELGGEERLGSRVTEYATTSAIVAGAGSKLVAIVGLTAGAMIGVLGAVAMSRLSGLVLDEDEAAAILQAPVVATIPKVSSLSRQSIIPGDPLPRSLKRTSQALAVRAETSVPSTVDHGPLIVVVAGAERYSGATTIAVALAEHFAGRDLQVLLIDANVVHPQLSDALEDSASGIGGLLRNVPTSNVRSRPYVDTAAAGVRFAGLGESDARQLLRRQDVPALLDGAAQHAQVVVIDGGPLMASAASVELAQRADAVVLTMPARRQTRSGLDGVTRALASRRGGLLPVVASARRPRHSTRIRSVAVGPGEAGDGPLGQADARDDPVEHSSVTVDQAQPAHGRSAQRARRPASEASRREASRGK